MSDTTSTATETQMDRERKLLAQAEHPATSPEEAETFSARAAELIAKYGIDVAMLAANGATRDDVTMREHTVSGAYHVDRMALLNGLAQAMNCRAVRLRDGRKLGRRIRVYGHASEAVQAERRIARTPVPPWEHGRTFRTAFWQGYIAAVLPRVAAAERAARDGAEPVAGQSAAVVLRSCAHAVTEYVRSQHSRLSSGGSRRSSGGSGTAHGVNAGRSADIGGARVGGGRAALPH